MSKRKLDEISKFSSKTSVNFTTEWLNEVVETEVPSSTTIKQKIKLQQIFNYNIETCDVLCNICVEAKAESEFAKDLFYYLNAKKCYVCGPSPHDLLENLNTTTLTNNCTDLDHLWKLKKTILAQETFGRECPEDYKSCLLQRDGNRKITIRSCEKLQLEDCQKANNVTYCYCLNDYCNHENVPDQPHILTSKDRRQQQQQLQHHSISDEINDDEDLNDDEEASGSKEQNTHRENSGFTTKTSDKSKTKKNSASRSLSPILKSNKILFEISYYLVFTIFNNNIRIS